MRNDDDTDKTDDTPPAREPDEEAGSGRSHEVNAPFSSHEDDDSELGDSDQHSDA